MMANHGNTRALAESASPAGPAPVRGRRALDEALTLASDGVLHDEAILMYLDHPDSTGRPGSAGG